MEFIKENIAALLHNEGGTALLELILVVPLYLALLSGLCLIGDLQICRNRLRMADRTSAWNAGLRHGESNGQKLEASLSEWFYPEGDFGDATKFSDLAVDTKVENGWCLFSNSSAVLNFHTPIWTIGIWKFCNQMFVEQSSSGNWDDVSIPASGTGNIHCVLMRKKEEDVKINRENQQGAKYGKGNCWYNVYQRGYFPDGSKPSKEGMKVVNEGSGYQRFGTYVLWSGKCE